MLFAILKNKQFIFQIYKKSNKIQVPAAEAVEESVTVPVTKLGIE